MEDWEFELDYLTHVAYEKAVNKANGIEERSEEFEVDEQSFNEDLKELMGEMQPANPNEWEVVDDQTV